MLVMELALITVNTTTVLTTIASASTSTNPDSELPASIPPACPVIVFFRLCDSVTLFVRFDDDLLKLLMSPSMDCSVLYQASMEEAMDIVRSIVCRPGTGNHQAKWASIRSL